MRDISTDELYVRGRGGVSMFDFKRVERPDGRVTELEACRDWVDATFVKVDIGDVEPSSGEA